MKMFSMLPLWARMWCLPTPALYPQNPDTQISRPPTRHHQRDQYAAGQTPTVTFTLQDDNGNNIPLSQASTLEFTIAGPTTDYGYTSFGSGTSSTPGYVTESASAATCTASGACTYTFTHAIPATATGTYTIGGEARMTVTVYPGTTSSQSVTEGANPNPVMNFSVDGSPVAPRRTVVVESNCNACHVSLSLHGACATTQNTACCATIRRTRMPARAHRHGAAYQTQPAQGINFNLLVHRLHDGVNAATNPGGPPKYPYIVVGHGGSTNDFSGTLFPVMSPAGDATYMQELRDLPHQWQRAESANRTERGSRSPGLDSGGNRKPGAARFVGLQRMSRFGGRIGPLPGEYRCVGRELQRMPCRGRAVRG
jgi:OmcA/MtrC family decaheme c-type cytochrome